MTVSWIVQTVTLWRAHSAAPVDGQQVTLQQVPSLKSQTIIFWI